MKKTFASLIALAVLLVCAFIIAPSLTANAATSPLSAVSQKQIITSSASLAPTALADAFVVNVVRQPDNSQRFGKTNFITQAAPRVANHLYKQPEIGIVRSSKNYRPPNFTDYLNWRGKSFGIKPKIVYLR